MKYAALFKTTIYHEEDERSRTNPGHGYPAYSETVDSIKLFADEDELKEWIEQSDRYTKYQIIRYEEVVIRRSVEFELG